ncbi:hypothetical protein AAFF_G00150070 [Aldrovandia affinis]|uniref:Uncharacterized protein n=1 Tax=Aldrovandia affinis TaxID=143900 RepID=A0AAD7RPN9_9TELE|nr:hypothetical protein AAFF_G00150070 [Aldrovandia affinis]
MALKALSVLGTEGSLRKGERLGRILQLTPPQPQSGLLLRASLTGPPPPPLQPLGACPRRNRHDQAAAANNGGAVLAFRLVTIPAVSSSSS